jgi:hypothetical protein
MKAELEMLQAKVGEISEARAAAKKAERIRRQEASAKRAQAPIPKSMIETSDAAKRRAKKVAGESKGKKGKKKGGKKGQAA